MTRIIITGANGKMGHVIRSVVAGREDCTVVAGVDFNTQAADFPIYKTIAEVQEEADVIIDFSNPALLDDLLTYSAAKSMPLVIATTGYTAEQKAKIEAAAEKCPIFFTYNMSMGINLLATLAQKAVNVLGPDFDIEIVEKHHNQKIDAPSGTALMLADAMCKEIDHPMKYEYDRHAKREKRTRDEIGIHAVRGGTIVGEHEIIFAGRDYNISKMCTMGTVGAITVAVFSTVQFVKLIYRGECLKSAAIQVGKQALFSLSLLAISIAAQGMWGGPAGIIVSIGTGIVIVSYTIADAVHQRTFAEECHIKTIEEYGRLALRHLNELQFA